MTKLLALLAFPLALSAQQVSVRPDSLALVVGDTARLTATVRGAPDSLLAFTGSNAAIFTAHRDGRITARAPGCAFARVSVGTWSRAQVRVCVTKRDTVVVPPIPPVGPQPVILFASQWGAPGRTNAAFLDGGKWLHVCCDAATNTTVLTPQQAGISGEWAGNVYRVSTVARYTAGVPTHTVTTDLGAPAVGETRYFRYYLRVPYGDDHGAAIDNNLEHGIETTDALANAGRGMNFYRVPRNDGTWWPGYREISTGVRFIASGLRLRKHTTYRMEWALSYGATSYTVQVRITDPQGNVVATEADFRPYVPAGSGTMRGAPFAYMASQHRYFRVGTNGPSSNFPMLNMKDEALFDVGAVAVCLRNWCGK